jgi:hypothetical protein
VNHDFAIICYRPQSSRLAHNNRSAMRANTTQKAYDDAFLACSTAVYFEGQVRAHNPSARIAEAILTMRALE